MDQLEFYNLTEEQKSELSDLIYLNGYSDILIQQYIYL